jgi:hypothetical protein
MLRLYMLCCDFSSQAEQDGFCPISCKDKQCPAECKHKKRKKNTAAAGAKARYGFRTAKCKPSCFAPKPEFDARKGPVFRECISTCRTPAVICDQRPVFGGGHGSRHRGQHGGYRNGFGDASFDVV